MNKWSEHSGRASSIENAEPLKNLKRIANLTDHLQTGNELGKMHFPKSNRTKSNSLLAEHSDRSVSATSEILVIEAFLAPG